MQLACLYSALFHYRMKRVGGPIQFEMNSSNFDQKDLKCLVSDFFTLAELPVLHKVIWIMSSDDSDRQRDVCNW